MGEIDQAIDESENCLPGIRSRATQIAAQEFPHVNIRRGHEGIEARLIPFVGREIRGEDAGT